MLSQKQSSIKCTRSEWDQVGNLGHYKKRNCNVNTSSSRMKKSMMLLEREEALKAYRILVVNSINHLKAKEENMSIGDVFSNGGV
jgi:hypothetical protein